MTIFGSIIPDDIVEDAVVATIRKWLPTYMAEVERQLGLEPGYYKRPEYGAYTVRADFDKFPEEMLPLVVIVSPGILDDPPKRGPNKTYSANFQINTTCIVSSTDQVETRRFASRMGAALRAVLVQHQSLDKGIAERVQGVTWIGERNNELPTEDERTIWANRQIFLVEVDDILSKIPGPRVPDADDYPPDPIAETVTVNIEKEPIPS